MYEYTKLRSYTNIFLTRLVVYWREGDGERRGDGRVGGKEDEGPSCSC